MSIMNTLPEDAASVLEMFIQDVSNTPAEITHLLEEIQAKDHRIQAYKDEISKRDLQLQKWVRLNGGHVLNPKEEAFSKTINECYDKCEILQAEKCGLAERASIILERQMKRLDTGLKALIQTEQFPSDWNGPSLLTSSGTTTGANTPAAGAPATAASLPLQAVSANIGPVTGAATVANAAQMRLAAQNATASARGSTSGSQTPPAIPRTQREGSSEANKRRRPNVSLGTLPASSSNLRQSSLGPGTPKAGTPVPASGSQRAGSAQPTRPAAPANQKKAPPPSQRKQNPRIRYAGATKNRDRRRQLARDRTTPSTNASPSGSEDEEEASATPSSLPRSQQDGSADRAEEDEGDDETLYCLCQKVSFGDMVGCDNDNCKYQWFHYKCVGVTEEPAGEWLCPTCRTLPRSKLRITKGD